MARVDYFQIEKEIQTVLKDDADLAGVAVLIEEELTFAEGNIILIELDRRDAPDDLQSISAGQRTRFLLQISLWCWGFGYERERAMEQRDDLLGKVEVALLKHRAAQPGNAFGGEVTSFWMQGGDFENRRTTDSDRFLSGASIDLICDVTATSV